VVNILWKKVVLNTTSRVDVHGKEEKWFPCIIVFIAIAGVNA